MKTNLFRKFIGGEITAEESAEVVLAIIALFVSAYLFIYLVAVISEGGAA